MTLASACPFLIAAALTATPAGAAPCAPDALGTSRTLAVGGTAMALGLKTYPRTLALADHEVVLTFDDGPDAKTTPRVLDVLARECVKATFFLIGRNAQAHASLVRREVADGHTVGHHTFSHPARTLRFMTRKSAEADIEHGFEADDVAAYGRYDGAPRVPFFRFPGFADTPLLDGWLAMRGVAIFGADLWASDWMPMSPDAERALILRRLAQTGGGLLLMHDIHGSTAAMLPHLLRDLKAGGYRIVHLTPGPEAPPVRSAPNGWTSQTDHIIGARLNPPAASGRIGMKPYGVHHRRIRDARRYSHLPRSDDPGTARPPLT